jgi:hypothetical protein
LLNLLLIARTTFAASRPLNTGSVALHARDELY